MRGAAGAACALLALLAGCAGGPGTTCELKPVAQLALLGERGAATGFAVAGRVNGRQARFTLDTGSYLSVMTSTAVRRFSLYTQRMLTDVQVPFGFALEGVGGRTHIDKTLVQSLELGNLARQGAEFAVLWSGYAAEDNDGLIGMDQLGAYELDFATVPGALRLLRAERACATPAEDRAKGVFVAPLPQSDRGTGLLVPVTLDGRRVMALLDTASEQSLVFDPSPHLGNDTPRWRVRGIGPSVWEEGPEAPHRLEVGGLVLSTFQMSLLRRKPAAADLVLGQDFFAQVAVWVSPGTRSVVVQKKR